MFKTASFSFFSKNVNQNSSLVEPLIFLVSPFTATFSLPLLFTSALQMLLMQHLEIKSFYSFHIVLLLFFLSIFSTHFSFFWWICDICGLSTFDGRIWVSTNSKFCVFLLSKVHPVCAPNNDPTLLFANVGTLLIKTNDILQLYCLSFFFFFPVYLEGLDCLLCFLVWYSYYYYFLGVAYLVAYCVGFLT